MRAKNFLKHLILGALMLPTGKVVSQVTTGSNVANATTDFLGWNNTSPANDFPLRVRHDGNWPIEWYTDAIRRMLLTRTLTAQTVNGYNGLDLSGHLGVGPFNALPGNAPPLTLLHLDNGGTEVAGYRPWMHTGTSMSEASEWMYVGFKQEAPDRIDAVINWVDNREIFGGGQFGPDALRMVFTSPPTTTSVSGSLDGLEIARLIPDVSGDEGYFGIGDFFNAGVQPDQRLHVLDGFVRFQPLPNDPPMDSDQFMVVDNTGVVGWRNLGTLPDNCEWRFQGSSNLNVVTALGTPAGCPGDVNNVGIGVNPSAKLHVLDRPGGGGTVDVGLRVDEQGEDGDNRAIQVYNNRAPVYQNGGVNTGIYMEVYNAQTQYGLNAQVSRGSGLAGGTLYGVHANCASSQPVSQMIGLNAVVVSSSDTTGDLYGLKARTSLSPNSTANDVYGVYGEAITSGNEQTADFFYGVYGRTNVPTAANAWAGYFDGRLKITGDGFVNGSMQIMSDATVKTNVEELSNANAMLAELQPKTYEYLTEEHPAMGFPTGPQMGFLAQEVEEVLPWLVKPMLQPAIYDSTGQMIEAEATYNTLNYIGLIPVLVGAVKEHQSALAVAEASNANLTERLTEQESRLEEQARRMDQLEAALASCCSNPANGDTRLLTDPEGDLDKAIEGDARSLHIQPNPFTERTTVHYRLERAGRMQLLANSADGKALKVLQEASLEAGAYQFNWETGDLTPGVYYITLLLDGEPIVKKAVKVDR